MEQRWMEQRWMEQWWIPNQLLLSDYWSLPNRHPRRCTSAVVGQNKQGEVVILLPKECEQLARQQLARQQLARQQLAKQQLAR